MKKIAAVSIYVCLPLHIMVLISAALLASDPAENYTAQPGSYQVDTVCYEWNDPARDREVPVKIYFPHAGDGPFPVIIFSHGLGSSREGYKYLGRHWASYGYISVHVQHHGSDVAVWQNTSQAFDKMRKAVKDPGNAVNRTQDVSFAIDKMESLNSEPGALKGRIDLDHIGMAGHSFGAWTTLAIAGQTFTGPKGGEMILADPRVKAAVAMSAPAPMCRDQIDKYFAKINIPCFHMTGTLDESPLGDTKANQRRLPFDHISGADQYLVILNGGDHATFTGWPNRPGFREKDPVLHDIIKISSTAFWDAYLKDNEQSKKWLSNGGLKTVLGQDAAFEKKLFTKN